MTARLSIAVLIVGCVAGCSEPGVAPPAIPGNVDEAQVAARIADADREVREALDSADAWGRLGVVYDVHRFFDRALECYGTATTLDPDEWRWPYFSGIVLRTSDQAAALEQFERAAELNPDHAPLQLYLGFGHFLEESVDEAGKHYARALELDPRSVNARIGLAQVALAGRDAGRAVQLLEEARDIAPQEAAVHHHLAHAYGLEGDAVAAERERVLAGSAPIKMQPGEMASFVDPPRDEATLREGVSSTWLLANSQRHLAAGRAQEAADALEALLEVDPESIPGLLAYARMFVAKGDLQTALTLVRRAVELSPDSANVQIDYGTILTRVNQLPLAIAAYQRALELDPDLPEAHSNLATLLFQTGKADEGLARMREAAEKFPGRADVQHNLANLLLFQGQADEAIARFRAALQLDPGNAEARGGLAIALWERRRYAEAIEVHREAYRRQPGNPMVVRDLAWALSVCPQSGLRDGAQALQLAQQLNQQTEFSDPRFLDVLAVAQAETGDYPKAVATLDQALKIVRGTMQQIAEQLAPEQQQAMMLFAEGLRQRQDRFKNRRPYREGS